MPTDSSSGLLIDSIEVTPDAVVALNPMLEWLSSLRVLAHAVLCLVVAAYSLLSTTKAACSRAAWGLYDWLVCALPALRLAVDGRAAPAPLGSRPKAPTVLGVVISEHLPGSAECTESLARVALW